MDIAQQKKPKQNPAVELFSTLLINVIAGGFVAFFYFYSGSTWCSHTVFFALLTAYMILGIGSSLICFLRKKNIIPNWTVRWQWLVFWSALFSAGCLVGMHSYYGMMPEGVSSSSFLVTALVVFTSIVSLLFSAFEAQRVSKEAGAPVSLEIRVAKTGMPKVGIIAWCACLAGLMSTMAILLGMLSLKLPDSRRQFGIPIDSVDTGHMALFAGGLIFNMACLAFAFLSLRDWSRRGVEVNHRGWHRATWVFALFAIAGFLLVILALCNPRAFVRVIE
jgi:hypothetical protein